MEEKLLQILTGKLSPEWKKILNKNNLEDILKESLNQVIQKRVKCSPTNPIDILNFLTTDFNNLKVVIVGQDPYPQPNISNGIAFSCKETIQPSLSVLLKELELSYKTVPEINRHIKEFDISLDGWIKQGVLLMNSSLTCEEWKPGSHVKEWRKFTTGLLKTIAQEKFDFAPDTKPMVFVFLGRLAGSILQELDVSCNLRRIHSVLEFPHPATEIYNGKFTGCGMFTQINNTLTINNHEPIDWFKKT